MALVPSAEGSSWGEAGTHLPKAVHQVLKRAASASRPSRSTSQAKGGLGQGGEAQAQAQTIAGEEGRAHRAGDPWKGRRSPSPPPRLLT